MSIISTETQEEKVLPATVNREELALILGITPTVLSTLENKGIIPSEPGDLFILPATVQAYITYKLSGKSVLADEERQLDIQRLEAELKYKEARARIAEFEAEELKGHLHRADDVETAFEDLMNHLKQQLLSLPMIIAVDVNGARSFSEVAEVIREAANDVIRVMRDYSYDKRFYLERAKERHNVRGKGK